MGADTASLASPRIPDDIAGRHYAMLIGGEWVGAASGKTFACVDPYTEQSWGSIPLADKDDVALAVESARRAFDRGGATR